MLTRQHKLSYHHADSSQAGIGVVTAFTVSVSLTFILVLYNFYFVEDSFPMLNEIDKMWIATANEAVERYACFDFAGPSRKSLNDVVLMFSDQQLVMGLAILIVGFSKTATITEYHFAIISNLSGMAFVVHLLSINIVTADLRRRPEKKWWRAVAIVAVALLSLVSNLPDINVYYLSTYGSPMKCIWTGMTGHITAESMLMVLPFQLLALWGLCAIIGSLYPRVFDLRPIAYMQRTIIWITILPRRVHYWSSRHCQRCSGARMKLWMIARKVSYAFAWCIFVITEVISSRAVDVTRDWALLLVYFLDLLHIRERSALQGKLDNESEWGFGQAVPVFLLVLPLLTLCEVYMGAQGSAPYPYIDSIPIDVEHGTSMSTQRMVRREQSALPYISDDEVPLTGGLPLNTNALSARSDACETLDITSNTTSLRRLDTGSRSDLVIGQSANSSRKNSDETQRMSSTTPPPPSRSSTHLRHFPAINYTPDTQGAVEEAMNVRHYYWDCPPGFLGEERFEDDLWTNSRFRVFMMCLPILTLALVTVAAVKGWAI